MVSSVGPVIVNTRPTPGSQGTAITLAATYRAVARLGTPSMLVFGGAAGVPLAMGVATFAVAVPMLTAFS